MAFLEAGISIAFYGEGVNEKVCVVSCDNEDYHLEIGQCVVSIDPKYFRPTEVELLIGDASKSRNLLGWKPKYTLPMLVSEMVAGDIAQLKVKGVRQYEHMMM